MWNLFIFSASFYFFIEQLAHDKSLYKSHKSLGTMQQLLNIPVSLPV